MRFRLIQVSLYYPPTHVLVFLVVSFPLAFPPIIYTRSSSPLSCYMARLSHPRLYYSNYTWRRVQITKLLVMNFPIQNGLKWRYASLPILFNISSGYAIRKVQEIQMGLKWNGKHQILSYADDVNLLGDNIDTIKKNRETRPQFLSSTLLRNFTRGQRWPWSILIPWRLP
jgi:hypothetical protein